MTQGDVTVIGIDTSTTVLFDIGMDVPHRAVVTIPANLASLSKDLWRSLSQRRIFQLHAGPVGQPFTRQNVLPNASFEALQDKCQKLEAENAELRNTLENMHRVVATHKQDLEVCRQDLEVCRQELSAKATVSLDPRVDEILGLLRSGVVSGNGATQGAIVKPSIKSAVVEVAAPVFIPAEIKPKTVEGRIAEVQSETSSNTNLGSAADALRKMRQGRQ